MSLLREIRKWLIRLILLAAATFLIVRGWQFRQVRDLLPPGTTVGGVDVSGITIDRAREEVAREYYRPLYVYHRENHVELRPQDVGFMLDEDSMFAELQKELDSQDPWLAFATFAIGRSFEPIFVPLRATHDRGALQAMLASIGELLDKPAKAIQVFEEGFPGRDDGVGYVTDVNGSLRAVEDTLYDLNSRVVQLVIVEQSVPEPSLVTLKELIETKLQSFDGFASVFVKDLQSGEEMALNADVAVSGLSIMKIAIFVEAYRALDGPPNEYQEQLFVDTATKSSNYGANLLLHVAAGEDNTYLGADVLTESLRHLGLVNSFIAVPYDASPPAYRQTTYVTPANSRRDITTEPDQTMQTTAEDVGTLLTMVYDCSGGGGALLALYPDQLTANECQAILDLMKQNEEGNLIRYGVPDGIEVAHKHGWALGTHGDAGIVFSPAGDYVLVEYLHQPGDWLVAEQSFPILREISRLVYNYFNMDQPFSSTEFSERANLDPNDPFEESDSIEIAIEQIEAEEPGQEN